MHTYKKQTVLRGAEEDRVTVWVVGYYILVGEEGVGAADQWETIRVFKEEIQAIAFVNYLNGGNLQEGISIINELLQKGGE